jgi:hypothetical protein
MHLPTLAATLLCAAGAAATESFALEAFAVEQPDVRRPFLDVRLGYGWAPTPDRYEIRHATGTGDVAQVATVADDPAHAISLGWVGGKLAPIGPVGGIEMNLTTVSQHLDGFSDGGVAVALPGNQPELGYQSYGGTLLGGLGLRLARNLHVEALGTLGGGWIDMEFPNDSATGTIDGGGTYWSYGARVGAYLAIDVFVIGVVGIWSETSYEADANWDDGSNTATEGEFDGFGVRLEIGARIQ